jgi:hypothetical protein
MTCKMASDDRPAFFGLSISLGMETPAAGIFALASWGDSVLLAVALLL